MALDDSLHRGEPHACALKLLGGVEPLEDAKELVRVGRIEPDAVVTHVVNGKAILLRGPELDPRVGLSERELPGIVQEVPQRDLDEARVPDGGRALEDHEPHRTHGPVAFEVLDDGPRQRAQVHPLAAHLRARQAREL